MWKIDRVAGWPFVAVSSTITVTIVVTNAVNVSITVANAVAVTIPGTTIITKAVAVIVDVVVFVDELECLRGDAHQEGRFIIRLIDVVIVVVVVGVIVVVVVVIRVVDVNVEIEKVIKNFVF